MFHDYRQRTTSLIFYQILAVADQTEINSFRYDKYEAAVFITTRDCTLLLSKFADFYEVENLWFVPSPKCADLLE